MRNLRRLGILILLLSENNTFWEGPRRWYLFRPVSRSAFALRAVHVLQYLQQYAAKYVA